MPRWYAGRESRRWRKGVQCCQSVRTTHPHCAARCMGAAQAPRAGACLLALAPSSASKSAGALGDCCGMSRVGLGDCWEMSLGWLAAASARSADTNSARAGLRAPAAGGDPGAQLPPPADEDAGGCDPAADHQPLPQLAWSSMKPPWFRVRCRPLVSSMDLLGHVASLCVLVAAEWGPMMMVHPPRTTPFLFQGQTPASEPLNLMSRLQRHVTARGVWCTPALSGDGGTTSQTCNSNLQLQVTYLACTNALECLNGAMVFAYLH